MATEAEETGAHVPSEIHCRQCGTGVQEGPRGGYVCGMCFHTVTPEDMPTPRLASKPDQATPPQPGPSAQPEGAAG